MMSSGFTPIELASIGSGTAAGLGTMPALEASTLPTGAELGGPISSGFTPINPATLAGTAAAGSGLLTSGTSLLDKATGFLKDNAGTIGSGLNLAGGLLAGESAKQAASTQADAQIKAAQIAADAAKFKPVGVTNNFGSSKFTYDDKGNIIGAGYELSPWLQAQQDQLRGASGGMLNQFTDSIKTTAPMGEAAQRAMQLGKGYLATDPQAQAQKYMEQQQALLAGSRASSYADMQNRLQQTGRAGLSVGGGGGMTAANPEMQAYYNAQRQQDLGLAANATQGGMDYAKFGVDMVNNGGGLLQNMYKTQTASYQPYGTALSGMQTQENMGRTALTDSMSIGDTISQANARAGMITAQGMANAAGIQAPANAYNPWSGLASGVGGMLQNYKWGT
jgi:hypothetical protein